MKEQNDELKIYRNRLKVADLITDVLSDKITVAQALSEFPKDKSDINIKCAFDALMHREADEDLRAKISGYALVQDDYLADFAVLLKKNKALPKNIIQKYIKFHEDDLISDDEITLKNVLKKMKRMINF